MPWLRDSVKVLTVERGTGHESGRLAEAFLRRSNSYAIREKRGSEEYGWRTTSHSKNAYAQALWMKMAEGAIAYMRDMVCTNPWQDATSRAEKARFELESQIGRFQVVQKEMNDPFSQPRTTISGKVGVDGKLQKGINDDLAVALAMGIYVTMQLIFRRIPTVDYRRVLESTATTVPRR